MNRIKQFFINTILGGLLVILPLALFLFIMSWVFGIVRAAIAPLTNELLERTALPEIVADVIVVLALVLLCFVVGMVLRTRLGKWIYSLLETKLLRKAPGLSLIHI